MLEGKRNLRILAFSDLHGSGFEEASSLIDHHLATRTSDIPNRREFRLVLYC